MEFVLRCHKAKRSRLPITGGRSLIKKCLNCCEYLHLIKETDNDVLCKVGLCHWELDIDELEISNAPGYTKEIKWRSEVGLFWKI